MPASLTYSIHTLHYTRKLIYLENLVFLSSVNYLKLDYQLTFEVYNNFIIDTRKSELDSPSNLWVYHVKMVPD